MDTELLNYVALTPKRETVEFSELVVGNLIGAGGYGKVFTAKHPDFPGTVAYKQINAVFIQPGEAVELKGEAKIHMRLDHPNIVKCFAVVFEPENYGMILEFMVYGEAKNYLRNNNNLRSKLKVIKDVATGMKYLHSIKPHAVIHGDLKSENILVGDDEIARVCDFGFSQWKEYSTSHSKQAVPLGTVTHVPPERWRDCNLRKNEMFDVYSFGITMWEILTLKRPFRGDYAAQIQIWVENGQRPDLRDIPAEVATDVVDLIAECWDGDPLNRPPFEDIVNRFELSSTILKGMETCEIKDTATITMGNKKPEVNRSTETTISIEASVLRQGAIDFKGHRMFVTSHQSNSMPSNDESYQSYQQTALSAQASLQGSLISDTIKVKNIPTTLSKDMVYLYFGSRRSGGGDLELIQWKPEKGEAVIRFEDSKVAMNVVKQSHKLSNNDLSVVLLEKPLDGIESYAVEVTGIPEDCSEDLITMYFENSRRIGGGEIEEFIWDKNVGKAVITFKKSDTVTNLLNKCPHHLYGQKVTVIALKPLPPPPVLLEDIDATRLLLKHLPTSVTLDQMRRFIEPSSNAKIAGFTWGAKPSVALVDFCSQPDYYAIRRLVSCKPIQGQMISVQRISPTRSVEVLDIPVGTTKEFLTMYFESARVIGNYKNVTVTNIDVFPGYAIVSFSDSKIINDISKKHTFLDTTVDVKPYFSFLGVSSSNPCEMSAVNFILHRRELTTKIEKSLGDKNCQIFWPSQDGHPIVLKFVPSNSMPRPSKDWVTNPKSQVQGVLDQLKLHKMDVRQDIWNDFQRKVQEYMKKSNLANVDVTYDNDNCVISYIGLHNATAELLKTLKITESDLLKNKQKVSEILQNLKPHIIMLIETSNLVEEIAQKFKEVQIEIKKSEISLSGPPYAVSSAKLHLYQQTNSVFDDSKDISPLQQKLLSKDDTKAYLTGLLLQKKIAASFAVKDKEIVVYAFNQNDLKRGYEFICSELVQSLSRV